jgi:hypothetical protein
MSFILLSSEDAGAPPLRPTAGDLCAVLDWALPQADWEIEHTSGNKRVYRPLTGNRRRLFINHDSTPHSLQYATARGCENATDVDTLIDPFPLVSQVSDALCNWLVSTQAVASVESHYRIFLSETFFYFVTGDPKTTVPNIDNVVAWWVFFFGDLPSSYPNDEWNTLIYTREIADPWSTGQHLFGSNNFPATLTPVMQGVYWARDITGTVKSTRGTVQGLGTQMGAVSNFPPMLGGPFSNILRERIRVSCVGSQTITQNSALATFKRGQLPNMWAPLHSTHNNLTWASTFEDTDYNPAALFRVFRCTPGGAVSVVFETTDTWSPA